MGEIFLARLEGAAGFEKLYVIKRILPHLADDARFRSMLIAEARIASKISHANICQVYELGETDGQLYIVMEYLEGITLLPLLRRAGKYNHQLDFGFVAGVVQQTADALHYAHELSERGGEYLGIVHRDISPSNIFLTEAGVAKVLDFGIAKVKDASATQTGTVKGKYAYMAPEQLRGNQIDRRVDIFALGVVIYEMLALRRLFQRKTDYLTFRAVLEQPIPDVRRYRADVPESLVLTLARALDRDPDARFATARQLGASVLDALSPIRPWSQGEISDFVRASFSDELGKRHGQVAQAIQKTTVSHGGFPLFSESSDEARGHDDDEDSLFPPVEDTISEPLDAVMARAHEAAPPTDFQGTTPPPFGTDSSGTSLPSLQQVMPAPPTPVVVVHKRSLVWPLVALAMVGIAGTALFLVWKQMQEQKQQPPPFSGEIVAGPSGVSTGPEPKAPEVPVVEEPGSAVEEPGSGSAPPKQGSAVKRPPQPPKDPYKTEIQKHQPQIYQCANDRSFKGEAIGTIRIGTDGATKAISFSPSSIDGSPLGTCIRNALNRARFPKAPVEKEISFKIRAS